MMIFMGVMFYKVPSGLGIYFITSSLWAIGERLLLPKVTHATVPGADGKAGRARKVRVLRMAIPRAAREARRKQDPERNGDNEKPQGPIAKFWTRILDEARKDPTYRNMVEGRESDKNREKDQGRDRERDRPRPKPRRR